jgi:hypothetical protein
MMPRNDRQSGLEQGPAVASSIQGCALAKRRAPGGWQDTNGSVVLLGVGLPARRRHQEGRLPGPHPEGLRARCMML